MGNDMKIDLVDIQECVRLMNSLDKTMDRLSARKNHDSQELLEMEYPFLTDKLRDRLA